jgi:plasmid stabilization system protein ParE
MALDIIWTKRAEKGYAEIIDYLSKNFTEKEIRKFVRQTHQFFDLLAQYPQMLGSTQRYKNLHRGPINKYTILTYRVKPKEHQIELINIRSTRKIPIQ